MKRKRKKEKIYQQMDESLNFFVESILLMPMSDLEKMQKLTELYDVYHFEPSCLHDLLGSQLVGHEEIFICPRENYFERKGNFFDICDAVMGQDYYVAGDKENMIIHILLDDQELKQRRYNRIVRLLDLSKEDEFEEKILYKK